jgi:hypothetical protein
MGIIQLHEKNICTQIKRATGYMGDQDCRVNGSGTPTSSGLLSSGGVGLVGTGLPGDRGSSADSGVRGSSDRESGATSAGGGNLSDSNTDGEWTIVFVFDVIVGVL